MASQSHLSLVRRVKMKKTNNIYKEGGRDKSIYFSVASRNAQQWAVSREI